MGATGVRGVAGAAIVAAVLIAGSALACGDKLVAMGGGVGFDRVVVSRHPGHIILMLEPDTGLAKADAELNLAGSLSLAGHEVVVARNAAELRTHRLAVAPDLILVDAARTGDVEPLPVADRKDPVILPVAYAPAAGARHDAAAGCVAFIDRRKAAQLLKTVEKALKMRSRGETLSCEQRGQSQQT